MNEYLLQLALDADFTSRETGAGLIPSRALFTNVKELAYVCEVDNVIRNAIEGTASGGTVPRGQLPKTSYIHYKSLI